MIVPVRVDFAGGWLDVPHLARPDGFIVNCAIVPSVSEDSWPYEKNAGIGGSAAWSLLERRDPLKSELEAGVGWQDPAIIMQTGLCAWRSGDRPQLVCQWDPDPMLHGKMALRYMGGTHVTANLVDRQRDYDLIVEAGKTGYMALQSQSSMVLRRAVELSYEAQIKEGMDELPVVSGSVRKYCGSGWGGYALYLFQDLESREHFLETEPKAIGIEPFFRHRWEP
jgi:hypothetical protein